MSVPPPYEIPEEPPADALAELDSAARALDLLFRRGEHLTLGTDEHTRTLRVELVESSGARRLTPTELFGLLDPG